MAASSDDDYISIDRFPSTNGAAITTAAISRHGTEMDGAPYYTRDAGRTPAHFSARLMDALKCGSQKVNERISSARHGKIFDFRVPNPITPSRKERFLSSGRKQRCLFNTMHVKTAMGLMTVFYLFALALLDHHLFWQRMDYVESLFFSITSIIVLIFIVTAQFGLNFEKYFLLIPFLTVQTLFVMVIYIVYSKSIAEQIFYAQMHPRVIMRLVLIMLYETIITFMHTYALVVTVRCIVYFRNKKLRSMDRLSFSNRCFMDGVPQMKNLKDRIVNLKIDLTTDDEMMAGGGNCAASKEKK